MEGEEELLELERRKLRKKIEKLDVDTRRSRQAIWLDWYKGVLAGLGGTSAVLAVAKASGWL